MRKQILLFGGTFGWSSVAGLWGVITCWCTCSLLVLVAVVVPGLEAYRLPGVGAYRRPYAFHVMGLTSDLSWPTRRQQFTLLMSLAFGQMLAHLLRESPVSPLSLPHLQDATEWEFSTVPDQRYTASASQYGVVDRPETTLMKWRNWIYRYKVPQMVPYQENHQLVHHSHHTSDNHMFQENDTHGVFLRRKLIGYPGQNFMRRREKYHSCYTRGSPNAEKQYDNSILFRDNRHTDFCRYW